MNINNSQNAQYTIIDLPKIIKIAREHALLGRYETSLKKYQIALEIIQARKKEVNVGVLRDKWKMTELNIKSEIGQTKQMLEACKELTNIDFNYFKKQIESNEIKKKKFQEKGVMVFDMSNNNRGSGPSNYFGSAPFSFNDPDKQDPFSIFQNDQINGIMSDSINSDVNEDDEKILNPLKPQKQFGIGSKKNKNKKKLGSITSINVVQNNKNKGKEKPNPWFKNEKSDNNNNIKNNIGGKEEKSVINPLEQFDISNSNLGDISVNSNNLTMDNNTTFMKEIKSFINKNQNVNQRNSYVANALKRKSMGSNSKSNITNNTPYPTGVGNYSNKNKIINFDKKAANKGALPVIMKKENQKIINNNKQSSLNNKKENNDNLLNKTNNNDISGVNMIDEALKNFGNMDNDESSFLDISKAKNAFNNSIFK